MCGLRALLATLAVTAVQDTDHAGRLSRDEHTAFSVSADGSIVVDESAAPSLLETAIAGPLYAHLPVGPVVNREPKGGVRTDIPMDVDVAGATFKDEEGWVPRCGETDEEDENECTKKWRRAPRISGRIVRSDVVASRFCYASVRCA